MTMCPRPVKIKCPQCGKKYKAIYWPSINLTLEDWTDEQLEEATTSTCPHCNCKVSHDTMIVRRKQGGFVFEIKKTEE